MRLLSNTTLILCTLLWFSTSGTCLFGTPTHEIQTNLVLAPGPDNPGNSEGDFTQLKDGMVLFIYSHFTGSSRQLAAHLASRESTDGGKTWSDADRIVLRPESNEAPVLTSVSLLRLRDGRISLFYLAQKSPTDSQVFMRTSSDECATWSSPTTCTSGPGYFLIDNDCVIQLKSGRLLFPVARHESPPKGESDRGQVICFYSDDNGASWHSSKKPLEAMANSHSGLKNPVVVELKDGRLMMLMVIHLHPLYRSYSTDRGESWSPPEKTDLATPVSTASIKRIPSTGDLLLVWNDHSQIDPAAKNNRTPLVAAVSSDEGKTWPIRKTIYHDPNGTYCYTAIAFVGDRVLLGHCAGLSRGAAGLARSAITTFPIHWLYP